MNRPASGRTGPPQDGQTRLGENMPTLGRIDPPWGGQTRLGKHVPASGRAGLPRGRLDAPGKIWPDEVPLRRDPECENWVNIWGRENGVDHDEMDSDR